MVFAFIQSYLCSYFIEERSLKSKLVIKCNVLRRSMHACDARGNIRFNYQFKVLKISNIKQLDNRSHYRILLLLSGNISSNPGPKKGLLIHLNINKLFSKIDEPRCVADSGNAAIMWISESELDESVFQINNYDLLRRDKQKRWRCCLLNQNSYKLH